MDNIVQVCFCSWDSNMQEIPSSDSFASPRKKGFLSKLTGKGWLYSGTWKNRYCVLDGSKFYFYENEQSKGSEKSCGVINLDYYDLCEEDNVKDKKQPHVFVIGTSVRGFFDNRHQFAAESPEELQSWIRAIQNAIAEARISRRKPGRKQPRQQQQEGKSPDLSNSSQESDGASTTCLVNVAKDRAKGPQGRRLPQRKSMMPTARSAEDNELRQRSTSLSSPPTNGVEEEESSSPKTNSDAKWISLSMEEMDREKDTDVPNQRSSSTFDIGAESENADEPKPKRLGPTRMGVNLLGQHAALTRELEMKLKAGMAPGARRPPSPDEDEEDKSPEKREARADKKIEFLSTKVDTAKDTLKTLEEKVSSLTDQVEATTEKSEQAKSQVGDVLLQVTVTLKEAERVNEECKRALAEANRARSEYQLLVKECKETLAKLHSENDSQ